MDIVHIQILVALLATAAIYFGYLESHNAVAKGYSRYPFCFLATFLLFPTMALTAVLPHRKRLKATCLGLFARA